MKRTDITSFSGLSPHRFANGMLAEADHVRLRGDSAIESLDAAVDLYDAGAGELLPPGVYTTSDCYDPDYETYVTKSWVFAHIAPESTLGTADFKGDLRFLVAPAEEYGKNADGYRHIVAAFCHGDELCILYDTSMNLIEERTDLTVDGYNNGTAAQFVSLGTESAGTGVWVRTLTQLLLDRYLPSGTVKTELIRSSLQTQTTLTGKYETHRTLVSLKGSGVYHYVTEDYAPSLGGSYRIYFDRLYTDHYATLADDYPLHTYGYPERLRKVSFCLWADNTTAVDISRRFLLLPEMLELRSGDPAYTVDVPESISPVLNAGVQLFGRLYGINESEIHASKNGTILTFTTPTAAVTDDPNAAWCDTIKGADEAFTAITAFDGKVIAFTARSMLTVHGQALPFELSYVGAYGCLRAEALAAHEKYLYFVSGDGVMRYDGTRVTSLDAPPAPGGYAGAELMCTGDLLLLYVPGAGGVWLYDIAGGGWSFRRAAGDLIFPGDNRESAHFGDVLLQNTGNGFRPLHLSGADGSFSLSVAVAFAGRRRLHGVAVTAALSAGAVLSVCGADGHVLHSFTATDGRVRTYFAALRGVRLDSGTVRLSGSGHVRIFGLSLMSEEIPALRRRIAPQTKKGGTQT